MTAAMRNGRKEQERKLRSFAPASLLFHKLCSLCCENGVVASVLTSNLSYNSPHYTSLGKSQRVLKPTLIFKTHLERKKTFNALILSTSHNFVKDLKYTRTQFASLARRPFLRQHKRGESEKLFLFLLSLYSYSNSAPQTQ